MDILSLFSGIGWLDLGVRGALARLGIESRVRAYVEGEAFAVAVLARAMEAGALDAAPVWSDVRTFGADVCPGPVDMVIGGFPCQDLSSAGKRAGIRGEKSGLFYELARIVRELEPRYIFMENVRGITVRGIDAVLGELACLGFDAEWSCVQAAHVGAPHKRERWFCMAYRQGGPGWIGAGSCAQEERRGRPEARWRVEGVADANGSRLEGWGCPRHGRSDKEHPWSDGPSVAWPPGQDDIDGWRRYIAQGGPEPAIRRGADGIPGRVDRLRALGNAVVPIQAEAAFLGLWQRIHKSF